MIVSEVGECMPWQCQFGNRIDPPEGLWGAPLRSPLNQGIATAAAINYENAFNDTGIGVSSPGGTASAAWAGVQSRSEQRDRNPSRATYGERGGTDQCLSQSPHGCQKVSRCTGARRRHDRPH